MRSDPRCRPRPNHRARFARSGGLPPTGASCTRRATKAMPRRDHGASPPAFFVKIRYMRSLGHRNLKIEHLVEVAIVEATIPPNGERVAAHKSSNRCRVKGLHELLHVRL